MSDRSPLLTALLPRLLLVATCAAQTAGATESVAAYDPDQLPAVEGQVQQFTMSPRGDIDGMILKDGTEVKTPPHLSTSIAYAIRPGDSVTIHGLRAAALPLIQAAAITDHASGRTIVDSGAGPSTDGIIGIQGAVRMSLHGARGEINGVLLQDGTVLRFPPQVAADMTDLLQPGGSLAVEGSQLVSPVGKVLQVTAIGRSRANLIRIEPPSDPRPRGGAGARGLRPDAPPQPPPGM